MTSTPALAALTRAGVAHVVHTYEHDSGRVDQLGGYGQEAADALGVATARVFKTLVLQVDSRLVVAICPVTHQVDPKAVARAVGGKRAGLAEAAAAERSTGYVVGGISPLGQRRRLPTVLDASALEHAQILVSGGRRGLDVELSPADLARLTGATLAAIAAG